MRVAITFDVEINVEAVAESEGVLPIDQLGAVGVSYLIHEYGQAGDLDGIDAFEDAIRDALEAGDFADFVSGLGYDMRFDTFHTSVTEPTIAEVVAETDSITMRRSLANETEADRAIEPGETLAGEIVDILCDAWTSPEATARRIVAHVDKRGVTRSARTNKRMHFFPSVESEQGA